jgi:hypothetical protein
MCEERRAKTSRRMKRELFPSLTDLRALGLILRIFRELLEALRDRGDALTWVEAIALEGVVRFHLSVR